MRVTADTNILLRTLTPDNLRQRTIATAELAAAETVAIPLVVLCELVWVLSRTYRLPFSDIAVMLRRLVGAENVEINRQAVGAGLAMLDAGGDFADGVIAFEGQWLGGDTFLSFDKQAVKLLEAQGIAARLLS